MGDAKSKSSTELSYTENKVEPAEHAIADMRGFVEETLILSDDVAHHKYVDVIMEDNRLSAEERASFFEREQARFQRQVAENVSVLNKAQRKQSLIVLLLTLGLGIVSRLVEADYGGLALSRSTTSSVSSGNRKSLSGACVAA